MSAVSTGTAKVLVLVTFGILRGPYRDPRARGFVDRLDPVFAASDAADGLIARYRPDADDGAFGPWATPRFVTPDLAGREAQTLSLWRDVESARAYTFGGNHVEALRHRREWFLPPAWPSHAAWWADGLPTWREAMVRLEHLHDHGPSAIAFPLHIPFNAEGEQMCAASRRTTPGL